jgi:hypothetical protein
MIFALLGLGPYDLSSNVHTFTENPLGFQIRVFQGPI